ncbi:GNAT family N-acetyltransferase [Solirubrobacter phytolaccae]|uniref:GNAT family N-acetyltransferase n=1 Tax=Solirubrobacter phytolaccae TaxID=1404360 RepID=A0A9X3NC82_9ACTN|nr:GNAT family protein [Solirubrobacter phytolaccae]MDA0182160.1 GNAT family N-acetyltransferase [Solirubrobacter phytolaccae]
MAELPWPSPPLADERVTLRPWREADVPAMVAAFHDPVFARFSDWAPLTESAAREHLVELEDARRCGRQIAFAAVGDVVLGGVSLHGFCEGRAGIGYWLAPHARGRGVATHAVRLLARWAFDELDVARLELTCGPDNVASQRVAERCGFTREGLLRAHLPFKGGRRDTVIYSLLPSD